MSEHRTRIDNAIDRAVRDIMRHDPPAGFRCRVLSRLARASAPSAVAPARRAFLWSGLAAAAAAIAMLAIANGVRRDVRKAP
jgi:hypothetical protein